MTVQTIVNQFNAITEGMFAGDIPCRSTALDAVMKCHPANAFFGLYKPLEDAMWEDDKSLFTADFLREIHSELSEYKSEVKVKALTKPLKDLMILIEALDRGETIELFED